MRKLFIVACIAGAAIACNNGATTTAEKVADSTKPAEAVATVAEKFDYPYTLKTPYQNWQPGD